MLFGINNLFNCVRSPKNNEEDLDTDVLRLERRVEYLERELRENIRRLEDKIDIKFELLSNKIDTLIITLQGRY